LVSRVSVVHVDDPLDPRVADYVLRTDPDLRRQRDQSDGKEGAFFIAEGALVIQQLLQSRYRVRSLLLTQRRFEALEADLGRVDAPVYIATQEIVNAISGFHLHRGALAAAARHPLPPIADVVAGATLVVVGESLNDHENIGAIFRNAAAFGAGALLFDATCADPLYRRSVRVSMGHVLRIPFTRVPVWPEGLDELRSMGFEIVALTPDAAAEDIRSIPPVARRALLLGAEGPGLSAPALAYADRRVRIPMASGVDSLNVATAAAVALHELSKPNWRQ
jgi:tRNA G18 (ribose-2'-O)-methylase SpoU